MFEPFTTFTLNNFALVGKKYYLDNSLNYWPSLSS